MTALDTPLTRPAPRLQDRGQRLIALAGGLGAGAAGFWLLFSSPIHASAASDSVTGLLAARSTPLEAMTILAVFASAALIPAALDLGRIVGGTAGRVVAAAGTATAVLLVAYIGSFAAGATVASLLLETPGAGVGEAALVSANVAELVRYGPSLALTGAVVVARRRVGRAVWIPAAALTVMLLFPMTTWLAAIIVPLWLGVASALRRPAEIAPRAA